MRKFSVDKMRRALRRAGWVGPPSPLGPGWVDFGYTTDQTPEWLDEIYKARAERLEGMLNFSRAFAEPIRSYDIKWPSDHPK